MPHTSPNADDRAKYISCICSILKALPLAMLSVFLCSYTTQDSIHTLEQIEVKHQGSIQGTMRRSDGTLSLSSADVSHGLHMLGEADLLRTASMQPGVNIASDYGAGLSVSGGDYDQTLYTVDGATVFFPYHFGGIFSNFNTHHAARAAIYPAGRGAMGMPYAGSANVEVCTPLVPHSDFKASANVGLLASGLSLHMPAGEKFAAIASARVSYVDQLYGSVIKVGKDAASYGLSDYNLTLYYRPTTSDVVKLSGIYGRDRAEYLNDTYLMNTLMRWDNHALSLQHNHYGDDIDYRQSLSVSGFKSSLNLAMDGLSLLLPSETRQICASGEGGSAERGISLGYRIEYNSYTPQSLISKGINIGGAQAIRHRSWLAGIGASKALDVTAESRVMYGARLSVYGSGTYHHIGIDPHITYQWRLESDELSLTLASTTQYSHFTGLSDIGMASNFFLPANRELPAAQTVGVQGGYTRAISAHISLDTDIYLRRVRHSAEYEGNVLSLLADTYNPYRNIIDGNGYNTGGSLRISYSMGRLRAWASYALAICRRKYDGNPNSALSVSYAHRWVTAANEPLHSIKAMAQWISPQRKWQLNAYFNLASGRPYTPIRAIYMIGGNVITEYGLLNSARLPLYHRLDLSATYYLPKLNISASKVTQYINLSLINAYGHRNTEMQYFVYQHNDTDRIILKRISSLYRFLPSISYTIEL